MIAKDANDEKKQRVAVRQVLVLVLVLVDVRAMFSETANRLQGCCTSKLSASLLYMYFCKVDLSYYCRFNLSYKLKIVKCISHDF